LAGDWQQLSKRQQPVAAGVQGVAPLPWPHCVTVAAQTKSKQLPVQQSLFC
jgi:hypothetical protein